MCKTIRIGNSKSAAKRREQRRARAVRGASMTAQLEARAAVALETVRLHTGLSATAVETMSAAELEDALEDAFDFSGGAVEARAAAPVKDDAELDAWFDAN